MFQASTHSSKLNFKDRPKNRGGDKLTGLLNWIENYILTDSFDADVRNSFTSQTRNERLLRNVHEMIDLLIYQAYTPFEYQRTYNLLDSFKVESGTPGDLMGMGVTVFSDVDVATATSGDAEGEFSYAAFFEKPVKFDSFIDRNGDDLYGPMRFRPFMQELTKMIQDETELSAIHALLVAFKKRLPGVRGKKK